MKNTTSKRPKNGQNLSYFKISFLIVPNPDIKKLIYHLRLDFEKFFLSEWKIQ